MLFYLAWSERTTLLRLWLACFTKEVYLRCNRYTHNTFPKHVLVSWNGGEGDDNREGTGRETRRDGIGEGKEVGMGWQGGGKGGGGG